MCLQESLSSDQEPDPNLIITSIAYSPHRSEGRLVHSYMCMYAIHIELHERIVYMSRCLCLLVDVHVHVYMYVVGDLCVPV